MPEHPGARLSRARLVRWSHPGSQFSVGFALPPSSYLLFTPMSDLGEPFTTRPELTGRFGMVAATHWLAAQAGMRMLELGGNAFDAAAAAGFALQVVEPHQNGLGGEVPMVLYSASDRDVFVVNGQGTAPARATSAHFRDLGLDLVPGTGLLGACVPGAFGGWLLLLDRWGSLPLREILAPAITYATEGFPALSSLCETIGYHEATFLRRWTTSGEMWLQNGPPHPGQLIKNPALGRTYERLVAEAEAVGSDRSAQFEAARRAFYEGFVAEALCEFATTSQWDGMGGGPEEEGDASHPGLLSLDDMASWRAGVESAVSLPYREFEVWKTGPWAQGPVMLQQLALLGGFDLRSLGPATPELVHVVTECAKLAFADREAFYGDPGVVDVPMEALLSREYNDERRKLVGDSASLELRPGSPGGCSAPLPELVLRRLAATGSARAAVPDGVVANPGQSVAGTAHDTCHVDVADRFGNLVSATPSGGWLQSSPAVPGLGFCLGTRAQMFWVEEGLASSIGPGARPRTTLSPSLAFRDGAPYMAFGTPGGDQQDQWPLKAFLYHAEFGLPLQAAIDASNWHVEHAPSSFWPREAFPGELYAEQSLGGTALKALRDRGHLVVEQPAWSLGRVTAVCRNTDGALHAGADARSGQAYAVGR